MYIIIIVYIFINSNHNASHIVLEHNELRHRKIKKPFNTKLFWMFAGGCFFLQSKKKSLLRWQVAEHLCRQAVRPPFEEGGENAGDVILDDFWHPRSLGFRSWAFTLVCKAMNKANLEGGEKKQPQDLGLFFFHPLPNILTTLLNGMILQVHHGLHLTIRWKVPSGRGA